MKRRFSISHKITIVIILVLILNLLLVMFVTAYNFYNISMRLSKEELDNSSDNIKSIVEKLAETDESNLDKYLSDYETKTTFKIQLIKNKFIDNKKFISTEEYNQIVKNNGDSVMMLGGKRYYIRLYPVTPFIYNTKVTNIQYELILAKELPLLSEQATQIINLSIIAFLLISIPTTIILYLFIRRFTKPIIQMSEIAEDISDGNFLGYIKVKSKDEIGDLANSLNNMSQKLYENERSRDAFLAGVSHELRTPLTTIKANTKGILDGVIPKDEVEYYLHSNVEEIDRLAKMVNDLILVSSLEQDKSMALESTNISDILPDVVKQMKFISDNKGVNIVCEIAPNLIFQVDRLKLKQVFINLLDNAIKFSPQGSCVKVYAFKEGRNIKITISDEGKGLSDIMLKNLFVRFYRDRKSEGLGLGLYISNLIVEAHNGKITAKNNNDKGATFEITFLC